MVKKLDTKTDNTDNIVLSVILVNWNTRDLLIQSVTEIKRETMNICTEIIIVDNASIDDSVKMVKAAYPDVIVIENTENKGFAYANNQGYNLSKGQFICYMNTDVELSDRCFEKMIEFIKSNRYTAMVGPKVLNKDGSIQKTYWRFETPQRLLALSFFLHHIFPSIIAYKPDAVKIVDYLAGCFWIVRRYALEDVGLLDERFFFYGEDKDWCFRCHKKGWNIVLNPDVSIVHYGGSSSSVAPTRYFVQQERAMLQFIAKHYSFANQHLCYLLRIMYYVIRVASQIVFGIPFGKIKKLLNHIACLRWLVSFKPVKEQIILCNRDCAIEYLNNSVN
ncbi:MAG TPA: glycosyltransferase family 2 protein [Chitinispirillaceae bacterium]|nr:glycosyltransferase family 2 protein [Chitinispirillaceae bacterium]